MEIRDAAAADAAGIVGIYNDAVARGTAIWNEIRVDAPNRAAWIAARQAAGFPVLAAAEGREILGYASYGDFRAFDGYRLTVEHSVYVRADARGRGLGRALLAAVIDRARGAGKHAMIAAIEAGNAPSIRLHEELGFVHVGLMPQVGMKFGRWLDLALLQLTLDDRAAP